MTSNKDDLPPGVKYSKNANGRVVSGVFTLDFPIEDTNPPVHTLNMRRMRVADTMVAEAYEDSLEAAYALYATLTQSDLETVKRLDVEDMERLTEALVPLMGKSATAALREAKKKKGQTVSDGAT